MSASVKQDFHDSKTVSTQSGRVIPLHRNKSAVDDFLEDKAFKRSTFQMGNIATTTIKRFYIVGEIATMNLIICIVLARMEGRIGIQEDAAKIYVILLCSLLSIMYNCYVFAYRLAYNNHRMSLEDQSYYAIYRSLHLFGLGSISVYCFNSNGLTLVFSWAYTFTLGLQAAYLHNIFYFSVPALLDCVYIDQLRIPIFLTFNEKMLEKVDSQEIELKEKKIRHAKKLKDMNEKMEKIQSFASDTRKDV